MFSRDNIRKTFTVMHNQLFEHSDTLSFALLACIILYINGKLFRCSIFTFVQYITSGHRFVLGDYFSVLSDCFLQIVLKDTAHHSNSSEAQNQGLPNPKLSITTFAFLSLKGALILQCRYLPT